MSILAGLGAGVLVALAIFVIIILACLISWSNSGCH